MEIQGAICGLEAFLALDLHEAAELVSDSQYTLGMATGAYNPTTNLEQVASLRLLVARVRNLQCRWTPGHMGQKYNELCDELAREGKLQNTPIELRKQPKIKNAARAARRKTKDLL